MSNTAANGKPADAESEPSVTPSAEADQSKQDIAAAVKALTEERNKLQEDIKELKVTYYTCSLKSGSFQYHLAHILHSFSFTMGIPFETRWAWQSNFQN